MLDPKVKDNRQHVFIAGCKGIPARYGGFETFVDHLVRGSRDPDIVWHVACQLSGEGSDAPSAANAWAQMEKTFTTHPESEGIGTVYFIRVHSKLGKAKAIFYDVDALTYAIEYCEKHPEIRNPIFYLLAYRIGPWMGSFARRIHRLGGKLYLNPDGHEWMRRKWSLPVRMYWKFSEKLSIRKADGIICDSMAIKEYVDRNYHHKNVTFIPYGADLPEDIGPTENSAETGSSAEAGSSDPTGSSSNAENSDLAGSSDLTGNHAETGNYAKAGNSDLAEAVNLSDTGERSSAKDIVDAAMADSRAGEHVANYMAVPDPVEAQYRDWLSTVSASEGNYLICVGRFVPENNYDIIIREFMACKKDMKLILITTINDALRESIDSELGFSKDPRVLISLPVYNERLLTRIRAGSFAYVHGHEVGGTNPSLLESLAASPLCLVLDVPFNHEVSADSGIYWTKEEGSLKNAIEKALAMTPSEKASVREKAIRRINEAYSWGSVIDRYEKLFKPASK